VFAFSLPRATADYNLGILHPRIADQWHPTKNEGLKPEQFAPKSSKRVWWKCSKGPDHEWQTSINNRTGDESGTNCPCCSGQKVSVTNSLESQKPDIAAEWHPTKNGDLVPRNVALKSSKRVWWKCPKGPDHEWQTSINNRTVEGRGRCPYCIGLFPSITNCLSTHYPDIAAEWHPTKNGGLSPSEVLPGSDLKRWWKCDKGPDHEWETIVGNRTINGTGCPYCVGQKVSVTNSFEILYPDIAAEWHPTKNGDLKPGQFVFGSGKNIWWQCEQGHEWKARIFSRAKDGTGCAKCNYSERKKIVPRKHFARKKVADIPELLSEWNIEKNKDLNPSEVSYGSARKIWWKCPKGPDHEWKQAPNTRTSKGNVASCPFCIGARVSANYSFAAHHPEMAKEWHPTRNRGVLPKEVLPGSNKKAWWKCPKGPDHVWEMPITNRSSGQGCPFCAGKRVSVTNSLATFAPHLAKEWHPTKNGELKPQKITEGSAKRVWWKCPKGLDHEWIAQVKKRTLLNRGCPFCEGKKVSVTNCVSTVRPELVKEWDYTKNKIGPEGVVAGSGKRVWWKCLEGPDHEWSTRAADRTSRIRNCPFCAGKKLSVTNRLDLNYPELSKEWHPTRNGTLRPERVIAGTNKLVWWRCNHGHEWKTGVAHRTGAGTNCPYCHIYPRSRQEVILAFEIMRFFDIDMESHKIRLGKTIHDVDIKIPSCNLVIEYDGSYWHRNKLEVDAKKVKSLEKAGWKTIRIREEPLKKLSENDIEVPTQTKKNHKQTADMILKQIEKVCNIKIDGLGEYLRLKDPVNKKAADEYIAKLLKDKEQTTLEV
jgi:very-short-patch-repair endonuclease